MSAEREERNGRNVCRDLFSHQGFVREYLYSPANSRTIIYVEAPMKRTTETTSIPIGVWRYGGGSLTSKTSN